MPKQRSGVTFAELFFGRSSRNAGDTLRFQWRLQCEQAATGVAMNLWQPARKNYRRERTRSFITDSVNPNRSDAISSCVANSTLQRTAGLLRSERLPKPKGWSTDRWRLLRTRPGDQAGSVRASYRGHWPAKYKRTACDLRQNSKEPQMNPDASVIALGISALIIVGAIYWAGVSR